MSTTAPARRRTARGFDIYDEFPDTHGCEVRVQLSSAVIVGFEQGAFVWIFCHDGDVAEKDNPPHLNVAQARRLRDALNTFIRENK